jgi:hypothetical protein
MQLFPYMAQRFIFCRQSLFAPCTTACRALEQTKNLAHVSATAGIRTNDHGAPMLIFVTTLTPSAPSIASQQSSLAASQSFDALDKAALEEALPDGGWAKFARCMTCCFPTWSLRKVGGMYQAPVQQAWREKMVRPPSIRKLTRRRSFSSLPCRALRWLF